MKLIKRPLKRLCLKRWTLLKNIAKAKKEESTELEEEMGSLPNSLKVLSKAGIGKGIARPGRVTDMEKLAQAIHQNYKAITGEKYQDSDQVAMSAIIADLIGHFRINGDKFIAAWDKTIKEETEISEAKRMKYDKVIKKLRDGEWESSDDVKQGNHLNYTDNNTGKKKVVFVEATEFVKGDRVMDVRTKLKGTVLHKGNKDEVYVDLGAIKKAISSKNLRLVEAAEQLDEVRTKPRSRDEKNAIQKVERLINSLPGIVKNLDYIYSDMERFNMNISQDDIDNLGKLVKEIEKLSLNRKEYDLIKNNLHEETDLLEFQSRSVERAEDAFFKLEKAVNQLSQIVKRGSTESKDLGNLTFGTSKAFAKLEKNLNDFQKYLSAVKADLSNEAMEAGYGRLRYESTESLITESKVENTVKTISHEKVSKLTCKEIEAAISDKDKASLFAVTDFSTGPKTRDGLRLHEMLLRYITKKSGISAPNPRGEYDAYINWTNKEDLMISKSAEDDDYRVNTGTIALKGALNPKKKFKVQDLIKALKKVYSLKESTELEEGKFDKLKKKLGRLNPESLELVLTGKIKLSPAEKKEFDDFMKDIGQLLC